MLKKDDLLLGEFKVFLNIYSSYFSCFSAENDNFNLPILLPVALDNGVVVIAQYFLCSLSREASEPVLKRPVYKDFGAP